MAEFRCKVCVDETVELPTDQMVVHLSMSHGIHVKGFVEATALVRDIGQRGKNSPGSRSPREIPGKLEGEGWVL